MKWGRAALAGVLLVIMGSPLFFGGSSASAAQPSVGLGRAAFFAVLAGTTVTNVGPTVVSGDLGVSPGSAVTGFPPGLVINGAEHRADAVALQAQSDLTTAYDDAAGRTSTAAVTSDLGGLALGPGVYNAASAMSLNGTVTLHGQGDPDSVFIFQAGSTLITASNSRVKLVGGTQACNVFWQVGSSATLGTGTDFAGSILAHSSVTVNTGATVDGRVLARHAQVSLQANTITRPPCTAPVTTTQPPTTTTTQPSSTTTTASSATTTTEAPTTTSTTASTTTTTTMQLPWPTCAELPLRCDPNKDPFVTTTTWHDLVPSSTTTTTEPTAVTTTTMTGIVNATTTTEPQNVGEPPGNTLDDLPKTGSPIGTSLLVAVIALGAGAVVARCGNRSSP